MKLLHYIEKAYDKIHNPCMIKFLCKLGMPCNFLNLIKGMCEKLRIKLLIKFVFLEIGHKSKVSTFTISIYC